MYFLIFVAFQLWCIEAKVNDAKGSGTDADVVLELSLADNTTCVTNSLNSWKNDFEVVYSMWKKYNN